MNWLLWSHSNRTDWKWFFWSLFWLTVVALSFIGDYDVNISSKSWCSCVYERNPKTNTYFVDVVSGVNVIKGQDYKMELLEEANRQLSDVFMVSYNIDVWIDFC